MRLKNDVNLQTHFFFIKSLFKIIKKNIFYLPLTITPHRYRLSHEYGITTEFTELWDRLQHEGRCCGILESQVRYFYIHSFLYHLSNALKSKKH